MADTPRIAVPVTTPFAGAPKRAPVSANPYIPSKLAVESAEEEGPRSASFLYDGLVDFLFKHGITPDPIAEGQALYLALRLLAGANEPPDSFLYCQATPGRLHLFVPVVPTIVVPPDEGTAQIATYLDGLTVAMPVPRVFESIAGYEMDDERRLGLYLRLPMPRTFGAAITTDALWLIGEWLPRELARQR
jgi:hypothetical protein